MNLLSAFILSKLPVIFLQKADELSLFELA